jgi:putative tricarboxylic transport membrane protein
VKLQVKVELAFACVALILGIYMLVGSASINLGSAYDRIGPRFFPYIIASGLIITGLGMLVGSLRTKRYTAELSMDVMAFGLLLLALLLSVLFVQRLGFILSMTLLFAMVARAFKSQGFIRDLSVGFILVLVIYFAFTDGLGLVLPGGVLSGIL